MRRFDDYFYEGGSVLANKFGIRNGVLLDDAVNDAVFARMMDVLPKVPDDAWFDAKHLRYIHGHLFQDCYDWAGEYRECPMGRNVDFCPPEQILGWMAEWSASFQKGFMLVSGDAGAMVGKLVGYWGGLNRIHPFRDGNGRSQAAFFTQACRVKGLDVCFSGRDIRNLRAARDEASDGRPAMLSGILGRSLSGEAVPYGRPPRTKLMERLMAMVGKGRHHENNGPDGPEL